jgi:hypothetical protein
MVNVTNHARRHGATLARKTSKHSHAAACTGRGLHWNWDPSWPASAGAGREIPPVLRNDVVARRGLEEPKVVGGKRVGCHTSQCDLVEMRRI